MKLRAVLFVLSAPLLLACSLLSRVEPPPSPTVVVPPTPGQGGITRQVNETLRDIRIGQNGASCDVVAADLTNQTFVGTLTIFPNRAQGTLRAILNNGQYHGTAAVLNASCQPTGNPYNLTATFGADYSATLGQSGSAVCIRQSNLVLTSFNLQGLPGPLNAVAQTLILDQVPGRVTPAIDTLIVRQLNDGQLPGSGAHCP